MLKDNYLHVFGLDRKRLNPSQDVLVVIGVGVQSDPITDCFMCLALVA